MQPLSTESGYSEALTSTSIRQAHFWLFGMMVVLAYAAGSWISYELFHASSAGAVLFPSAGVTFAALVLADRCRWPLLLCLIGSTELLVDLVQGQRLHLVLGFVLANTVEPLLGATIFRRYFDIRLQRRRDLLGLVSSGVLTPDLLLAR
jgi:integral membrane sensor domain MASE1